MHEVQAQVTGRKIEGRELAKWCASASQFTRICIGAALKNGELALIDLTPAQIAKLARVKTRDINAVASLPPDQRGARVALRKSGRFMTNAALDQFIARVGVGNAALDRATMPNKANGGINGHAA